MAKETAENPNDKLLDDLRVLEKKMGLVLTLVSPLDMTARFLLSAKVECIPVT